MSDKQVSTKNTPDPAERSKTSGKPVDHVAKALADATAAVTGLVGTSRASMVDTIQSELQTQLDSLTHAAPPDMPHPKNPSTDPLIAPFWHQHQLDLDKAKIRFANAESAAGAALDTEINNWSQAKSQYTFAMGSAHAAMLAEIKTATDAYKTKNNLDSHSRSRYLFYTMQAGVAAAIQDHEKGATTAAAALASEAGALIAAHATFLDAIGTAQGNLLADQAAAEQAYWQGVEQVRDTV